MPLERILVLDDEPIIQKVLEELFRRKKYSVNIASTIAQAEALLARETYDLVMLDVRLPDGDGHQLLERLMGLPEKPLVVMMTGHGTIESAVVCMRTGAFDYLIKPFTPSQIEIILKKADSFRQLVKVNRYFSEQDGGDGDMLGRSSSVQRLRQLVMRVAPTDASVLITGENGTGKEMVARSLWKNSQRRSEPYIKVNCAALSENLIESELFGHEKGSFTGATERREGRFELANRGTLLLDEVSEIPPNLQAKLLRVLQEREFERVGGTKTIKVNVRILATSNRDLLQFVERGSFRSDLYYRLNVFPVMVPALRERAEDILVLADAFLTRFARKHGVKVPGFTESARQALLHYPWPGNVRELQNTIERAVILAEDGRPIPPSTLGLPQLPKSLALPAGVSVPWGTSPPIAAAGAEAAAIVGLANGNGQPGQSTHSASPLATSAGNGTGALSGMSPAELAALDPLNAVDEVDDPASAPGSVAANRQSSAAAEPAERGGTSASWELPADHGTSGRAGERDGAQAQGAESASPTGVATREPMTEADIIPLDQMEKHAILAALIATQGNRTKTAELLNISIRTLRNKLQEYRASGDYVDAAAD